MQAVRCGEWQWRRLEARPRAGEGSTDVRTSRRRGHLAPDGAKPGR
ncbi:hypothetical protein ACFOEY_12140 [Paracandidimonas soli]